LPDQSHTRFLIAELMPRRDTFPVQMRLGGYEVCILSLPQAPFTWTSCPAPSTMTTHPLLLWLTRHRFLRA
jgi:hypothetical protein